MVTFDIDGKEYELKLTYESISQLNKISENNNPMEVVGLAMQGDLEVFPKIVHAALFHTKENFTLKKVQEEINNKIANDDLDYLDIVKIGYEVVANSFFYKRMVEKSMKSNPGAKEQIESLLD